MSTETTFADLARIQFDRGMPTVLMPIRNSGERQWQNNTIRQAFGAERAAQISALLRNDVSLVLEKRRLVDEGDLSDCCIGGPIAEYRAPDSSGVIHAVFRRTRRGTMIPVGVTTLEPHSDGYTQNDRSNTYPHSPGKVISDQGVGVSLEGVSKDRVPVLILTNVNSRRLRGYTAQLKTEAGPLTFEVPPTHELARELNA